jgi:hypothetical protein
VSWNTTRPPKRKVKSVRLRFQDPEGKVHQSKFYWSDREGTWIDCTGLDIALYERDGWKVLGWKN